MKLSARAGRRLVVGLSLASAAVLLPTAALAASSAGSSASAPATHRAVGPCHSQSTRVWDAQPGDGGAGSFHYDLEFSNVGHSACTFAGYPGISALDSHGNQVGLPATRMFPKGTTLTLQPGDTAHVILRVVDAGNICQHPVNAVSLKIFPPGQFSAQHLPFPTQACPGHSVLSVDALQPSTGIPNFQIH
jgi:hypothetical protein